MTLAIMLGLAEVTLPSGDVRIHNCHDDDDKVSIVRSKGKSTGGERSCVFSRRESLARYGSAFAKLGGTATKTELAKVITDFPPTTIYQYLIRHQGDTTRIVGKRGREYVWEWIGE